MAGLTGVRGRCVGWGLARRVGAVVAAEAVSGDVHVIEIRRYPRDGGVTVIAIIAARYVRRMLAGCGRSVVAGTACANDLCVVHLVSGYECHVVVTILANIAGLDMGRVLARGIRAVMTAEAVVENIRVIESGGYPAHRRMAVIAVVAANDVGRILALGNCAIVAGVTGTNNVQVIDPICRCEDDIVMTVLADIGGLEMRWILACRIRAIVAAEAIAGDVDVIEVRRNPAHGRMAVIAVVATTDMSRILAFGNRAVMAGVTGADNLGVIDLVCRRENGSVMAVIASIAGAYVLKVLAYCYGPVVTGTARADHLHMVHPVCRSERHIVMAVFANAARLDVCRVLAGSIYTVMAAEAVVDNVGVIESGRCPACGCMAVIAGVATGDMCRVLAFGNCAVVAGVTGTNHVQVIHAVRRCEDGNVMAVLILPDWSPENNGKGQ